MGDAVSLLLSVEEAFAVEIADDEAEKIHTVGALHALICAKLAAKWPQHPGGACVSSLAFWRVRRALVAASGLEKRAIRPRTPLETLLPPKNRRAVWVRFSRDLGAAWPDLKAPRWEAADGLFLGLIAAAFWVPYPPGSFALVPALMGAFLCWCVMRTAVNFHSTRLPGNFSSVGDLAREIAATDYAGFVAARGTWTEAESWRALQWLVAREAGLPLAQVTRSAEFYRDLDFWG